MEGQAGPIRGYNRGIEQTEVVLEEEILRLGADKGIVRCRKS